LTDRRFEFFKIMYPAKEGYLIGNLGRREIEWITLYENK